MGYHVSVRGGMRQAFLAAAVMGIIVIGATTSARADEPAMAQSEAATPKPDPVIGVDRFDTTFQISSKSGEPVETQSIQLLGPAPSGGVGAKGKGYYELSSDDIDDTPLVLGIVDGAFTSPDRAKQQVKVRLKDLNYPSAAPFHISAIAAILKQTANHMNKLGLIAVLPHIDPSQIKETKDKGGATEFKDERADGNKSLKLIVQLGVVTDVRTIASGDRLPSNESRINAPQHEKIRYDSPVWPAESSKQDERKDIVRKDLLDEYVYRLNRYPGRRVDVAVSQGDVPGGIVLDYLVSETKPWTIYAQASNTGTRQTNEWRERFGYVNNQLTGHDDTLSLDYITAGFSDASEAVSGSYEFPIPGVDRLRGRVYGSYSDFTASDVGQTNNNFSGEEGTGGAELILNVWQHRDWFGDVFAGGRFEHVHTNNETISSSGSADFGIPYVGGRIERVTDTTSFSVSSTLSYGFTGANRADLDALGRLNADDNFVTIEAAANYSFYIEPLLFPDRFVGGQEGDAPGKLANELAFSARGQSALGSRLIPQHEEVAGGLYSVRGYPESIVAGDDVIIGSAEYRFHLPRALDIQPTPKQVFGRPFRVAPDRPLGRPDWDLIFKGFIDAAQVVNNSRQSFEDDQSLVGAGVGVELQLKQNFNFQVYWGVALTDVPGEVDAGDNRFHFIFTVLY